jgi:hypothetical protein
LSTDTPKIGRCIASFFSPTCTSRSGAANGSGRTSTVLTTLKIAVLAPIASATVSTTAALNTGERRSVRAV